MAERRRRERIVLPDGTEAVQTRPPRADLLRYPGQGDWHTVLVRRTHDVELARRLAEELWKASPATAGEGPLGRCRIGWWTTTSRPGSIPPRAAVDERGRLVVWCVDATAVHAAGPGIEFRPLSWEPITYWSLRCDGVSTTGQVRGALQRPRHR